MTKVIVFANQKDGGSKNDIRDSIGTGARACWKAHHISRS